MKSKHQIIQWLAPLALVLTLNYQSATVHAQGTAFTYQGQLQDNGGLANGLYDIRASLWSAASAGTMLSAYYTNSAVAVSNGLFTVLIDFGPGVFTGGTNWLQIGVRTNGGAGFTGLSPRQQVTPTPYAILAEGANAAGLSGTIPPAALSGVNGSGLTNVNAATLGGLGANNFWQLTGNTVAAGQVLGSLNSQPVLFDVNGTLALTLALNGSLGMGTCSNLVPYSVAMGYHSLASGGSYEVAIGNTAQATGNGAIAIGWRPIASGPGAVALGESTTSSANDSFAAGYTSIASGQWSVAIGDANVASGQSSWAVGHLAQAPNDGAFVWADDSSQTPFVSTGNNQFLIQASGGVGIGTASPQQGLSVNTGMNLDQANLNAGFLNNGSTNGAGLSFGPSSGEGIASQRQAGAGNRYGLDFYTDFARRMSISQGGWVGIGVGTNAPDAALEVANGDVRIDGNRLLLSPATTGSFANDGLYYDMAGLPGINSDTGPFLGGYWGGALGGLGPTVACLSWDASGDVWVNDNLSAGSLTVRGSYAQITGGQAYNGNGAIDAYIGGSGSGSDVQIGSSNPLIMNIGFWNTGSNAYMHIYCSSITVNGGADLAEPFQISTPDQEVPQGAVVVIDEANPGHLKLSDQPYDARVAGAVSGANGISPGIQMQQQGLLEGGKNVALTGRVYVQADASNGAIHPGDLLTTSATPGHAMKVTDHARAQGAILGKAMTALNEGRGMVLVLVTLQ